MIAWVDVETTGLDPGLGHLLEVGILLTDDSLREIDRVSELVLPPRDARAKMESKVAEMHDHNGLWQEVKSVGLHQFTAEYALSRWLGSRIENDLDRKPVMAGSSVHFDRAWLRVHMPVLENLFHYRNLDVSTLKETNRRFKFTSEWHGDRNIHRSLPDLEDSIAEFKHYLSALHLLGGAHEGIS